MCTYNWLLCLTPLTPFIHEKLTEFVWTLNFRWLLRWDWCLEVKISEGLEEHWYSSLDKWRSSHWKCLLHGNVRGEICRAWWYPTPVTLSSRISSLRPQIWEVTLWKAASTGQWWPILQPMWDILCTKQISSFIFSSPCLLRCLNVSG